MWRRVLSWMYSLCSLKTLSEIIYLPHQLQLKCVEGVSQAEICSLGCISWRTSLLSLQMVSKEACYKGPPFKTRFHELDGCQASGKAKNDARRSVAIASLSSLFWYDKEYILEFIFRWKTTQGLVKNVIKSSILFVTKEWRGAVYFLFYVEQTRQACLNPQKRFSFCQNDAGMLRYEKQVKLKKNKIFWRGAKWHKVVGEMRKCVGEVTQVVGEVTQVVGEMKQFCWGNEANCWGNEAILLGKWHKNRWGDAPNTKCSIPALELHTVVWGHTAVSIGHDAACGLSGSGCAMMMLMMHLQCRSYQLWWTSSAWPHSVACNILKMSHEYKYQAMLSPIHTWCTKNPMRVMMQSFAWVAELSFSGSICPLHRGEHVRSQSASWWIFSATSFYGRSSGHDVTRGCKVVRGSLRSPASAQCISPKMLI